MADTLRELVVALSLDSGNFTRNMKTINLQIKEAESEFTLAGAGVEKFSDSAAGSAAKLDMLGKRMDMQKLAVREYEKRLGELQDQLLLTGQRHEDYQNRLADAQREMEKNEMLVRKSKEAYSTIAAVYGESSGYARQMKEELEAQEDAYRASQREVKKASGQVKAYEKNMRDTNDSITRAKTGLNNMNAELRKTQSEVKKTGDKLREQQSTWYTAAAGIEEFGKKSALNHQAWVNTGKALSRYMTTPIIALGTASVKSAIEYESAFASVRKTVEATEAEYTQLSDEIQRMSTELAMSAEEIAELAAVAGQLGIKKEELIDFTRTMVDLGNTTNVSAEEAATALARFANITGMEERNWSALGSAIVALGNNFATTESEIIEMAYRLAAAGKQVGMTEDKILAIAAALSSVGIEAQMGGSAFSKALVKMEVAAETGGEALTDFANVSRLTEEEFVKMWDADPTAAFMAFVEGLALMDEEGQSAIVTLQDIGISEVRLRDTMLRTVNANELFNSALQLSNEAWNKNVALSEEANKRYGTNASKLTNLKNKFVLLSRTYGEDMEPTLRSVMDSADMLIDKFLEMDETQRASVAKFATIAATIGPAMLMYGTIKKSFEPITKNAAALIRYFKSVGTAAKDAGGGLAGFATAVANKKGLVVALTVALAAGVYAFYDWASGAKAAREALEGMEETARSWQNTMAQTIYNRDKAGLESLGLDGSVFKAQVRSSEGWLNRMITDWNDNQKETETSVQAWIDSYKALNGDVRSELERLNEIAIEGGNTEYSARIQSDIDLLNKMDEEVEKLLEKRKNRNLTEKEQIKLEKLIDMRDALVVKYELRPVDGRGFDEIQRQMENAVARARVIGNGDMEMQAYEDAIVGAAQGMQMITDEMNAQYDEQRNMILLLDEGEEQERKLAELDQKYAQDRAKAAEEYAALLSGIYSNVLAKEGLQEAKTDLAALNSLITQFANENDADVRKSMLGQIQDLMADMDESALVEYLALIEQIKSLETEGIDIDKMFPDVDFKATDKLAAIKQFLNESEEMNGLNEGIEAVVQETLSIATDLDMEPAKATWEAFAADPGTLVSSRLKLSGYDAIAYRQFLAANSQNPITLKGKVSPESMTEEELKKAVFGEETTFWKDGTQIPFTAEVQNQLSKENFLLALDEDGGYHVVITPNVEGTEETVKKAQEEIDKTGVDFTLLGEGLGMEDIDWKKIVDNATARINKASSNRSLWQKFIEPVDVDSVIEYDIEPMQAELTAYLQELAQYKAAGNELTEQEKADVASIIDLLEAMDTAEVGEDIIAGVLEGMRATDLSGDAELTRDNLISALNTAFDIHSPAGAMEPTGGYIAAGVGKGMRGYSFDADIALMRKKIEFELRDMSAVGFSAMMYLAAGIASGQDIVVSAMRTAAKAVVKEATVQFSALAAGIVRNANISLGYIGQGGGSNVTRNNTRNTYNQNSSTTVTGNTFILNDGESIRNLQRELAVDQVRTSQGFGIKRAVRK